MAGHDSLWYWTQARAYREKGQKWNAYFYYTTAAYLATPADFLTSANLDKLNQETEAAKPDGLPGAQPMVVTAGGKTYSVTDLHTDGSLGGFDLVMRYAAARHQRPRGRPRSERRGHESHAGGASGTRRGLPWLVGLRRSARQQPYGNELAMADIH